MVILYCVQFKVVVTVLRGFQQAYSESLLLGRQLAIKVVAAMHIPLILLEGT